MTNNKMKKNKNVLIDKALYSTKSLEEIKKEYNVVEVIPMNYSYSNNNEDKVSFLKIRVLTDFSGKRKNPVGNKYNKIIMLFPTIDSINKYLKVNNIEYNKGKTFEVELG